MKITLLSDDEILLEESGGILTIEATSVELQYSPYHMLASALASCTFSVLHSWSAHAKLKADDLKLRVSWEFAENPHRVGSITMRVEWPSLPAERRQAATRAASLCPVHHTLTGGAPVAIEVTA